MTKLASANQAVLEVPFRIDSIAQVEPPDGGEGIWHRYVLSQGSNTITGIRAGTRVEVSQLLEGMVERLNERLGKQQAKLRR